MIHNHHLVNYQLKRYVVLTNKNEYIIQAVDDMEAAYRAANLAGLLDEELKDVAPAEAEDTSTIWSPND
tara:strand:+ start:113 stop:319 length:207 start_codon:yes stop_codon:yes gene_type:complete